MSAPSGTTPSCSSASPTAPSTRASTPHSRPISRPRPARLQPPGLGLVGGRSVLSGDGDHPMTSHRPQQEAARDHPVGARRRAAQPRQPGRGPAGDRPRRPAVRLSTDDVLAAAPGLLDGRLSPADFRVELHELGSMPVAATEAPQSAPEAQEEVTAGQEPQPPTEPAQATEAPAAGKRKAKAKAAKLQSRPRPHRPTSPRPAPAPSRRS